MLYACSKVTFYCSKQHQKSDWKTHKAACMYLRANPQSSLRQASNADEWASDMTGTFRWPRDHAFQKLSPSPFHNIVATACVIGSVGWKKYFQVADYRSWR